jgi:flagellar biosynthesis/type III secretory pathway chaperone
MIKYNISNIEEFDEKIRRGELNETDVFEDFTRLDYLLDREEKLRKLLEELEE